MSEESWGASGRRGDPAAIESFTAETFSGHVGSFFRIYPGSGDPLVFELTSVAELGERSSGRRQPFSIVFRAPKDLLLPQRIYRMEHEEIGTFDLFLVPIGPDEKGLCYEAIFT